MSPLSSSTPSAAASTLEPRAGDASGYKGKVLRSWGQLPAEVIRSVAHNVYATYGNLNLVPLGSSPRITCCS